MNGSGKPKIGSIEKITRFGCRAMLGLFVGLYFIAKCRIVSFGTGIGISGATMLVCGCLALKLGDESWYGMF